MIPFNIPYVPEISKQYVLESLESVHQQGDGPFTKLASDKLSTLVGGGHTLLTPSCTHALEMASMLANLGPGDEVILPSYTFTSAATAVVKFGATPVFVDIDKETKCIDVNHVRSAINSKTKAISWVNYAGAVPDINGLQTLANEFELLLIEDNAHGLGASYNGKPLGSFGDFSAQSFHATKNVQCGEGGALIVNNPKFIDRAEIIREKGTNRSKFLRGEVQKYQWVDQGSSYLMAESLAALLLGQLENFDFIHKKRNEIFSLYSQELENWARESKIEVHPSRVKEIHSAHMFYLVTDSKELRDDLIKHFYLLGIQAMFHYQSLASSIQGVKYTLNNNYFPITQKMSNQLLRLPIFVGLEVESVKKIVDTALGWSPR